MGWNGEHFHQIGIFLTSGVATGKRIIDQFRISRRRADLAIGILKQKQSFNLRSRVGKLCQEEFSAVVISLSHVDIAK